jgi:hypothetical protein
MWNLLNCYLSGRHDFGVSCEPGTIFLRCMHCGKRSSGWALKGHQGPLTPAKALLPARTVVANAAAVAAVAPLPFTPRGVGRLHRTA